MRILIWLCFCATIFARQPAKFGVAADGSSDFRTVQEAVNAAPGDGAVIRIKPGMYREAIAVNKPFIELRGVGKRPEDTVLSYDLSAGTAGGTGKSASVTVNGDDFFARNLTIENTFSRDKPLTHEGSQAVALRLNGDRAVLRRVRLLGYQDTLYANSKHCDSSVGPCTPARQYFEDCYIEGNVDFIFGDAMAFFENCEIHSLAHGTVMITAQSKLYSEERSGYVFDHCQLTAEAGAKKIFLGRPWRAYASVVFLNTAMDARIEPTGWAEWEHDGKPSLPTVYYAEFNSMGPGARPKQRNPYSHQLTAREAERLDVKIFLRGEDDWDPTKVH